VGQFAGIAAPEVKQVPDSGRNLWMGRTLSPMTKAEEFRSKAEEAEAKARTAHNSTARQAYVEIPRHWREMAKEVERQD
jgi:hypothetical protein